MVRSWVKDRAKPLSFSSSDCRRFSGRRHLHDRGPSETRNDLNLIRYDIVMETLGFFRARLGESVRWDSVRGWVWWVDITSSTLHAWDLGQRHLHSWRLSSPASTLAFDESNGVILALRDGFAGFDLSTGLCRSLATIPQAAPDDRFNDGAVDCRGRFWAGTMSAARRPDAALFCLDANLTITQHLTGVTVSNGLDWSPDNRRAYYVDTATRRIDTFEFCPDAGRLTDRQPFVLFDEAVGKPDGLTVDAEGCVWVALWGGGAVHRYSPEGRYMSVIPLPVSHPTSVAFGGPSLELLFVTSAQPPAGWVGQGDALLGGATFVARPGAVGRAPYRFGR